MWTYEHSVETDAEPEAIRRPRADAGNRGTRNAGIGPAVTGDRPKTVVALVEPAPC